MASSGRGPAAVLALYELLYVYEGQARCRSHRPGLAHANAATQIAMYCPCPAAAVGSEASAGYCSDIAAHLLLFFLAVRMRAPRSVVWHVIERPLWAPIVSWPQPDAS